MKIEKITICNLTSLEGEQVIDFTREPLRSAGLFAITGDTGAGKSTILDAVCLALYNKAPRFDGVERITPDEGKDPAARAQSIQASDVRGILRRGCREGYARVVFATHGGGRYEAAWSLRLKRTGSYDRAARSLRQLAPRREEVPEKEVAERIVQLTGLDYTQFTRTVMLAQNSFANFLKARREEKSLLLEKLTGTEIYGRVSQKIHEFARQAEEQLTALEQLVAGILHDRLPEQEKAALEEKRTLLTAAAADAAERVRRATRQLQWLEEYAAAAAAVARREAEHAAAGRDYAAMRLEEGRLERYDTVLGVQPLYQEIIVRRRDIEGIRQAEQNTASQVSALETRLKALKEALAAAADQQAAAEAETARRRPAINRGHAICGELAGLQGQLGRAEEQLRTADRTRKEGQARLQEKKDLLARTAQALEQAQYHHQTLSVHRLMFEKFDLVKDKLTVLNTETQRNTDIHRRLAGLQKQLAHLREATGKCEERQHADEAAMAALRGELQLQQGLNRGIDGVALQRRYADCRGRLVVLRRAEALWRRIAAGYEELSEKQAAEGRLVSRQQQLQDDMERAGREHAVLDETCRRLNVALTLSQSENIRQLRQRLKEGTACPVCGATHHPYHTETERELGELLDGLEKEYGEAAAELAAKRDTLDRLSREYAAGQGRLDSERAHLAALRQRQAEAVEEWADCAGLDPSFADCSPSVARDARRLMIGLLLDNTTRTAEEVQKELDEFNLHQERINRLNEEIAALEVRMADGRSRIEDLRTQYKVALAAEEETERARQLSDRSCGELYADLDRMVTLSGWFTAWKNNADGLRLRLSELFSDWQRTCAAVEEHSHTAAQLREEIKAGEQRAAEAAQLLQTAQEERDGTALRIREKRRELEALLGGMSPEREEARLQEMADKARGAEAAARGQYDDAAGQLRLLQGSQRNLLESRLRSQADYRARMADLDVWIARYNAQHPPIQFAELETIFADRRDWKQLRQHLQQLREAVAMAANRLQAAREVLLELRSRPERPAEETPEAHALLTADTEEARSRQLQTEAQLAEINLRLHTHENSLRQAAAYDARLAEARDNLEQWRRLDTLLGSHDGKKFRELAQSYTFSFLVEHANEQLRQLSPRYELRCVPGQLTLEIIDRDMFDQRRYVSSLSGGETFVVSLALALGLSSLSADSLTIGSLFIDEGFGNLDHASLDLVMSALANMENVQGRKVGVISHTEQIRSQISPQIRLVKQPAGGRSLIEIG